MTEREQIRQDEIQVMATSLFLADAETYNFREHCIVTFGSRWQSEFEKEPS